MKPRTTHKFYVQWKRPGEPWSRTYYPNKTLALARESVREACYKGLRPRVLEVIEKIHKA